MPLRFQSLSEYSDAFARLLCEEHCEALRQMLDKLHSIAPFEAACSSQEHWKVTAPSWCLGPDEEQTQGGRLLTATFRIKGGSAQSSQIVSAKRDARLASAGVSNDRASLRCLRTLSLVLLSQSHDRLPSLPASYEQASKFTLGVVAQDVSSSSVHVPLQGPGAGVPSGTVQLWLLPQSVLAATVGPGRTKRPRDETQAAATAVTSGQWNIWEVGTATTVLRELLALAGLQTSADASLLGTLLHGQRLHPVDGSDGELAFQVDLRRLFVDPATIERMRASFTPAQFRAIVAAAIPGASEGLLPEQLSEQDDGSEQEGKARVSPITLIQGPPGTGKTTTLAAMLNAVHINAYNAYHELLLRGRHKLEDNLAAFHAKRNAEEQPFRPHTPPPAAAEGGAAQPSDEELALLEQQGFSPQPDSVQSPDGQQPASKRSRGLVDGAGLGARGTPPLTATSTGPTATAAPTALALPNAAAGVGGSQTAAEGGASSAPSMMSVLLAQRKAMRESSGIQARAASSRAPLQGLIDWLGAPHGGGQELLPLVLQGSSAKPRMLVVAHSNTAVDNVLCRILERKFRDAHGTPYTPPLLRVGSSTAPPVQEAGLCLEDNVNKLLHMHSTDVLSAMQREAAAVKHYLGEMSRMKAAAHGQLHQQLKQVAAQQGSAATPEQVSSSGQQVLGAYAGHLLDVSKRIAVAYREQKKWERLLKYHQIVGNTSGGRTLRGAAKREATDDVKVFLRNSMLEGAEVVFSTLSSAARGAMGDSVASSGRAFDTVIVDEAGQATEASTLVPLQFGAQQLVLIGDPQQLPATVLSKAAADAGLERSLFARLVAAGHPVHLLDVQYRMHPSISAFPSQRFYGGRVKDAPSVCGEHRAQAFHAQALMGPLMLFNVQYGSLQQGSGSGSGGGGSHSYCNAAEADVALAMLFGIMAWRGTRKARQGERADANGDVTIQFSGSVGLFTPYDGQSQLLRRRYAEELRQRQKTPGGSALPTCAVDISTVDAAQGQERDIVILSTVRAAEAPAAGSDRKASIGFLRDTRRMNVALTRARYALWVVGNIEALKSNPDWAAFVSHCRDNGKVLGVMAPFQDPLTAGVDSAGNIVQQS